MTCGEERYVCPLRCDVEYCKDMPASDRSWEGWRLLQKILHADRRDESRLAHMGPGFVREKEFAQRKSGEHWNNVIHMQHRS
jgi:hypothetical protein